MSGQVSLGQSEISVGEANGPALITIVRTGDLSRTATVQFGLTPDSASAGIDFVDVSGNVTFQPGQSSVQVSAPLVNDTLSEATETFVFSIINADSDTTVLFPRTTRINILDDETPVTDVPIPPLASPYSVTEQPIAAGLNQPISFQFSPQDESLIYIAEKQGKIRIFDTSTNTFKSDFVDLSAKVNSFNDRGLMDIAFHPDFDANPYLYAFYVVDPPDTAGQPAGSNAGPDGAGNRFSYVVRFTVDPTTGAMVPGSDTIIVGGAGQTLSDISGGGAVNSTNNLSQPESGRTPSGAYVDDYLKVDAFSHAGGALAFGPDGMLYISTGDGSSPNTADPRALSVQDVNSLSGKILRVDPITGQGLPDNPFYQTGDSLDSNHSKVYQLGLRNPFSMTFDASGNLFIANTGWNSWEEIESGQPGANFGWPYYEGGDNGVLAKAPGYQNLASAITFYSEVAAGTKTVTPAFRAFSHAEAAPGYQIQTITGGDAIYTGTSGIYPVEFQNAFFFSDFSQGEVYFVNTTNPRSVQYLYPGTGVVDFLQGPDGFIYYADLFSGTIGKVLIEKDEGTGSVNDAVLGNVFVNASARFDTASSTYTLTAPGLARLGASSPRADWTCGRTSPSPLTRGSAPTTRTAPTAWPSSSTTTRWGLARSARPALGLA